MQRCKGHMHVRGHMGRDAKLTMELALKFQITNYIECAGKNSLFDKMHSSCRVVAVDVIVAASCWPGTSSTCSEGCSFLPSTSRFVSGGKAFHPCEENMAYPCLPACRVVMPLINFNEGKKAERPLAADIFVAKHTCSQW
mmetsp:Transcript_7369/g.10127  ORF Transcript_7369/g.10127 Transcript_7369/m.10127 type:complete len:140 (+) Transcript_7369:178-597(+)